MKWFWQRQCDQCKVYEEGLARLNSLNFKAEEDSPMVVDAAFEGAAVKLFAAAAVHWFKDTGGKNFVTLDMSDPRTGEHYEVTMQKAGGLTPAQKMSHLKMNLNRAVEKLHELADECAECGGDGIKAILTDKGYVGECPACSDVRLVIAICADSQPSTSGAEGTK